MPDIFDEIAPDEDIFDRVAAASSAPRGDIFDEIAPDQPVFRGEPIEPSAPQSNKAADLARRFGSGLTESTMQVVQGAVRNSRLISDSGIGKAMFPVQQLPFVRGAETAIRDFAGDVQGNARSSYGVDEARDSEFSSKVVQGAASIAPIIASGPFAIISGGLMAGEAARQDAEASGADERQQNVALVANTAVGVLTEKLLGVAKIFSEARKAAVPPETLGKLISSVSWAFAKGAPREGAQEGLQQTAENAIARYIAGYDPDRGTFDGVPESMAIGAIIGGPVNVVVQAATDMQVKRTLDAADRNEAVGNVRTAERLRVKAEEIKARAAQQIAQAETIPPETTSPSEESQTPPKLTGEEATATSAGEPSVETLEPQTVDATAPSVAGEDATTSELSTESQSVVEPEATPPTVKDSLTVRDASKPEQMTPEEAGITEAQPSPPVVDPDNPRSFRFADIDPPQTVDAWIALRDRRRAAEVRLIQEEIGLTPEQAEKAHQIIIERGGTGESWAKQNLTPAQRDRWENFWEESPYNQKDGPVDFWDYDSYFDPAQVADETSIPDLASDLVLSFTNGLSPSMSDKWIWAVAAARRIKELGGTKEDVSNALLGQVQRVAGSESSAQEWYRTHGAQLNELLNTFAADIPTSRRRAEQQSAPALADSPQPSPTPKVTPPVVKESLTVAEGQPTAPTSLDAATIRDQSTRVEAIVNDAVAAGRDRIEAENEAQRIVDSANAAGKPVDWNMVRAGATGRQTQKRGAGQRAESLDAPVGEEQSATRGEFVADEGAADPAQDAVISDVREAVATLPEQQRQIIKSMLDGMSGEEIAANLGVSRQRVNQIYQDAKGALRRKMGPGAANIEEPLASYEERSFGKRFQQDETIEPEVRERTGNRYYEPIPNVQTVAEAEAIIDERGIDEAQTIFRDKNSGLSGRVRVTLGQALIKKQNRAYAEAKKSGDKESASRVLDNVTDNAEILAEIGTEGGQWVQAFAIWSRLTPDGILLKLQRTNRKTQREHKGTHEKDIDEAKEAASRGDRKPPKGRIGTKLKKVWPKIVEAAKDGELTDQRFYEVAGTSLGVTSFSSETMAKLRDMAIDADGAPEGFQRDQKIRNMLAFAAKTEGLRVRDILFGVYYANMLSGHGTQEVNTIDTNLNVLTETLVQAIRKPSSAADLLARLWGGLRKGAPEFMHVLTTGQRVFGPSSEMKIPGTLELMKFGEAGGVSLKTDTTLRKLFKWAFETKAAYPLNAWKYVGRLMMAMDTLNFAGAKDVELYIQAAQVARAEGLQGKKLAARVTELLHETDSEWNAAMSQAASEGLTGIERKFRAIEIVEQQQPEAFRDEAEERGLLATYNHSPKGVLGWLSNGIEGMLSRGGSVGMTTKAIVIPFTRIVANVSNRGLNYTPWGYKRAFLGHWGSSDTSTDSPPVGGREFQERMIKATLGTLAMATLYAADEMGLLEITASGPEDKEKRNQLYATGWRPYSIRFRDGPYVSYIYTPIGLASSIIGNLRDWERYGKGSQEDGLTRTAYAVLSLPNVVMEQSFLSGVQRTFDFLNRAGDYSADSFSRFVTRPVTTLVVPNLVRDMDRLFAPNIKEASGISEALVKDVPVARQSLRPMINVLGETVKPTRNRFISSPKSDPVWKLVVEKQAWIPVPRKGSTKIVPRNGRERPMSPEEYYSYIKATGPEIKSAIQKNVARLRSMSDEDAKDWIASHSRTIRDRERRKMSRQISE